MSLITFLVIAIFLVIVLFCVGGLITYSIEREHQDKCKKYITVSQCEIDYYEHGITSVLGNGKIINFGDEV